LVREAKMVCRVQHPAIVSVFDLGVLETNEPFLVMERLDGVDLATVLEDHGRLDVATVADLAEPIADALETLHGVGIVHRDVKPENVFLLGGRLERPRVKLIDFGLAILDSTAMERLTQKGRIVGTAEYLAPECVRGATPTAAADVYALAATVFELLAGRVPFDGAGLDLLVQKTKTPARRLSELCPGCDPDLEDALARALSIRPEERPTASELALVLRLAADRAARMTPLATVLPPAPPVDVWALEPATGISLPPLPTLGAQELVRARRAAHRARTLAVLACCVTLGLLASCFVLH
jgi:serine/threonine protein kinase